MLVPRKNIPKKPILNREILEDVFIEIMKRNNFSWFNSRDEKNIESFMASGRQPFNIALNYVTRINSVEIWTPKILLFVNNEKICSFTFEFFVFLKPVLYAIGPSIKKFVFVDRMGVDVDVDMIFGALIHEGIEYKNQKTFLLPWVKDLFICPNVELSDFTAESVEHFVKCILEIFPNIEELHIQFNPSTFKTAYGIMKILKPHLFKSIPLSIKGNIEMEVCLEEMESLDEFDELTGPDNEYVIDIFMARKEFKIHEDFVAYLFARC
uniref:CRAL-TRIO domain-containing protein n=1 Tax=Panagrolaimus davidi TaxID=227884 RepID=A0A914P927_9BILA